MTLGISITESSIPLSFPSFVHDKHPQCCNRFNVWFVHLANRRINYPPYTQEPSMEKGLKALGASG